METSNRGATRERYVSSWELIAEKVEQILNPELKTTILFEALYSRVYRNVCDGYSEQMHIDLITLCSRHLNRINQQLCPTNEVSVAHLLSLSNHLSAYLRSIKNVSSVFSYLNKFYVDYYLNTDLYTELTGLFCQIIVNQRLPALMTIVETSHNTTFLFPPAVLHCFFRELHQISQGEYATKYPIIFSKYCPNVLPSMKETDLEGHIAEVGELQDRLRVLSSTSQESHGMKRPAEEEAIARKPNYQYRSPRTHPTTFH